MNRQGNKSKVMWGRLRGVLIWSSVVAVGFVSSFGGAGRALALPAQPFSGPASQLTAPDGLGGDDFGWATAVSGSTAVFGAYGHDAGAGAAYVFTGASWTQQTKLQATNGQPGDNFGEAVAVDGDTAAIGAPASNGGSGAVYIFGFSGSRWTQVAELTAPDGQRGDAFGQALVLSGTTLIVGAPNRNSSAGAAYVFTGSGSNWTMDAELTAPDGAAGDGFASAIALDGTTAVFGAPQAGSGGAAYIFAGAGTTWSEQAELSEGVNGSSGDGFGYAVALTGSTAFIGAPGRTGAAGDVYLFSSAGGSWTQQATLAASDGQAGDRFGISLAVSDTVALIGSSDYRIGGGVVYVFTPGGGSWQQSAEVKASHRKNGSLFGESVSLSGTTAVVGSYASNKYQGAGYVFTQGTTVSKWAQAAQVMASDGQGGGDLFGRSVALSGTTLVVGAPDHNAEQGAVYIYTSNGSTWSLAAELSDPAGKNGDMFGLAVAISGSTILIGAPGGSSQPGAAYVYDQSGSSWSLQTTLTPVGGAHGNFGHSVAISGSTAVVGGGSAVYVFAATSQGWSQVQALSAPDGGSRDRYGFAVGVSRSALVVGAPGHNSSAGIAYFYGLNGSQWTLQSELAGSDPAGGDVFGSAVAVSGSTAVIGAPGININHVNGHTGTAYVFVATNGTWSQQAEIIGPGLHNGQVYGTSVAISPTGRTVAVSTSGRVWIFTNAGGTWPLAYVQSHPPQPMASFDPLYGRSLGLSDSTLAAGAPGANSRAGAAFVTSR
jgi:hypothetical protein